MSDLISKKDWHIEKSVSVGHILTTIIIVVGGFTYFSEQDKLISANAQSIEFLKAQRAEDLRRIEKRLDLIDSKLDKLISNAN
uniref:hypothetical protein n=1 Tax=Ningiella ruwaisensis TaxID=2364274 RepID=UPI0010A016D5|nr:hypothetical protein [Ningiella ruwaisensis]